MEMKFFQKLKLFKKKIMGSVLKIVIKNLFCNIIVFLIFQNHLYA